MKHVVIFSLLLLSSSLAYCMENSQPELKGIHYKVERKTTDSLNFFGKSQISGFTAKVYEEDKECKRFLIALVKAQNSSVIEAITNNIFDYSNNNYRVLEALFIHFNHQEVYVTRRVDPSDAIAYEICVKKICEWNISQKLIVPQFGKWVNSYGYDQVVEPCDVELTVTVTPSYK